MKIYYVYIISCADASFYTGITSNLEQRLQQHQQGHFKDCYTYKRRPLALVYHLGFNNVLQAIRLKKQVKGWTRTKKLALINDDFEMIQSMAECRNFTHSDFQPK